MSKNILTNRVHGNTLKEVLKINLRLNQQGKMTYRLHAILFDQLENPLAVVLWDNLRNTMWRMRHEV